MTKAKTIPLPFWTIAIILLTLNIIVFSVMIIIAPDDLSVQYIPDDAYYYLTLSRNFSSLGLWTFDSSISKTSGFHPLFAYLLSTAFKAFHPDVSSFVTYGVILSLLFVLATITTVWYWGFKHKNVLFIMFLALVISSHNFIYNTISITEWSLTVLITSSYCVWFFIKYRNTSVKLMDYCILFTLGLLGSVARSDFGLLPFSIVIATFTLSRISITARRQRQLAIIGLLGTLTGLLIVFVHNYLFTNEILQSSAKMKAYWGGMGLPRLHTVPILIAKIVGIPGLLLLALLIVIAVWPRFFNGRNGRSHSYHIVNISPHQFTTDSMYHFFMLFVSAGVSILGYTLIYARNAAVQPWYTANLIMPVFMLLLVISDYITAILPEKASGIVSLLFLSIIIFNSANLYPVSGVNAPWPHQKYMMGAGIYLRENFPSVRVGAWNAGIIGYYEGGHVVNLDGLVNNDIYTYAVQNTLPAYLASREIHYIIDFDNMLTETRQIRGGYKDVGFLARLKPQKVFDSGALYWKHLTLYWIDDGDPPD